MNLFHHMPRLTVDCRTSIAKFYVWQHVTRVTLRGIYNLLTQEKIHNQCNKIMSIKVIAMVFERFWTRIKLVQTCNDWFASPWTAQYCVSSRDCYLVALHLNFLPVSYNINIIFLNVCIWENFLHFVYAPRCVSFFYEPNCINAPQKVRCIAVNNCCQVRLWNDLPYTVFDTGTLDGFKGAVNRWLLPCVVYFLVFRGAGACGVEKTIY